MTTKELISAVGGAMQEAYEQLERRSLENCLAGCFDLRNDSGEGVYVPRTITVSYPGPNGEELIRSPLAALMGHGVMNMEYVKVTLPLPENEAGGGEMEMTFIMAHAQDTLMTTMILEKQTRFTIDAYKRIAALEAKLA